ncbi:MAG: L,D-transpeptidase [Hyphomicrobiales bacterium]|nr:L,D-transpeptidase [Hyphomicrobiales bacterium]
MLSPAFSGPLDLNPPRQPQPDGPPQSTIGALFAAPTAEPPVQMVNAAPNLGGGFIELLFRGPPGAPPPRYHGEPPPAAPLHGRPRPRDDDPEANGPEANDPRRHAPDSHAVHPRYQRQEVGYAGREAPGTVIINTRERLLYLVQPNGRAIRYGIGVGRPGFTWAGAHTITNMREWPDWRPPPEMLRRQPNLPRHMTGGPDNPLGARAMYLGSTLYRIHGSNEPWTIGQAVSSGCIRMRNEDVIHLYERVRIGTRVIVI